jgi:transposase-like protein
MSTEKSKTSPRYPAELRSRGVRLFREQRDQYDSDNAAYIAIAPKLGCSPDTLRSWHKQAERDAGHLPGPTTEDKARIKALEREVKELRTANEILKKASAYFAMAELDRPFKK